MPLDAASKDRFNRTIDEIARMTSVFRHCGHGYLALGRVA